MPIALQNRPDPSEYLQLYIDAFIILSNTRKSTEAISLSDIFIFADTILEDRIEFAKIMMAGDDAFLKAQKDKAELNNGTK